MRVTSEQRLSCPDGLLVAPQRSCGTGVLVLAGSSGRVDTERVRLLGQYGATAMSIQWFGGPGQQPQPLDIPLETFTTALDRLARHCERLAVIGLSFGAEAALSSWPRVTPGSLPSSPSHRRQSCGRESLRPQTASRLG